MLRAIFFFLIVFAAAVSLGGQALPENWYGTWTGDLEIWRANQKVNEIPMSLEIRPVDTAWTFIITYNAGLENPDVRNYFLAAVNDSLGHYVIDERNGILLDTYLFDNCLYDNFSVDGNEIFSRICLNGEVLEYEMTSGRTDPVRISGDTVMGTDTIPAVNSYPLLSLNRAFLRRER